MIPNNIFRPTSTERWMAPDDIEKTLPSEDFELGGVAISNPSEGLRSYSWKSIYEPVAGAIILRNDDTVTEYTILTGIMNVVWLSFAFDTNMRPVLAYTLLDGTAYHYWFNIVTNSYITTTLPLDTRTPSLTLDDKRPSMATGNRSDVLLFYILGDKVYYRMQRDRYEVSYQIATLSNGDCLLGRVGMGSGLRIQLEILGGSMISSP